MTNTQAVKPAFRKPWTFGAYGYHEADTFAAAIEGFKRVRTTKIFHMGADTEAAEVPCAHCGIKLGDPYPVNEWNDKGETKTDTNSTWTYSPEHKAVGNGMHYGCSWSNLFNQIFKLHDAGRI